MTIHKHLYTHVYHTNRIIVCVHLSQLCIPTGIKDKLTKTTKNSGCSNDLKKRTGREANPMLITPVLKMQQATEPEKQTLVIAP